MASYFQAGDDWLSWRYRVVTYRTAMEMVAANEAIALTRKHNGQIITIYRESKPLQPSSPTACTLTAGTTYAVAAATSSKHRSTAGELAHIAKYIYWPFIPVKAGCQTIRPRVGEQEFRQYESLIRRASGVKARPKEFKSRPKTRVYRPEPTPVAA